MVTEVLFVMRQRVRAAGQSLAGDGMLLRLRNASIALVAAVAAVGLGLTLFIAQLGFPGVFTSPIPAGPTKIGAVHDAVALTRSPAVSQSLPAVGGRPGAVGAGRPRHPGRAAVEKNSGSGAGRGGPRHLAVSPGTVRSPAGEQPNASVPAPAPAAPQAPPVASAPSPAPVPAAVESPKPSPGGQSKESSDGEASLNSASAKAIGDGSAKSKGPRTAGSDGHTASVANSNGSPAEKAGQDRSSAAAPKPTVPPPPPAAKPAPETAGPAAAKEAADSARSDGPHH
ncbi:MAG TPA: hypothetical protein VGC63_13540 [Solirubrobacterales bacterium]